MEGKEGGNLCLNNTSYSLDEADLAGGEGGEHHRDECHGVLAAHARLNDSESYAAEHHVQQNDEVPAQVEAREQADGGLGRQPQETDEKPISISKAWCRESRAPADEHR